MATHFVRRQQGRDVWFELNALNRRQKRVNILLFLVIGLYNAASNLFKLRKKKSRMAAVSWLGGTGKQQQIVQTREGRNRSLSLSRQSHPHAMGN